MRADLQVLAERVRQYQQQMLKEEEAYVDVSSCIVQNTVVQTLREHLVCRSYKSSTSHKKISSLTLRFASAIFHSHLQQTKYFHVV